MFTLVDSTAAIVRIANHTAFYVFVKYLVECLGRIQTKRDQPEGADKGKATNKDMEYLNGL